MLKIQYISKAFLITIVLIFFIHSNKVIAQNVSKDGDFEVDFIIGCGPLTVNVKKLFAGGTGSVLYNFDNTVNPESCNDYKSNPTSCFNGDFISDTRYTFNEPGTYYIIQVVGASPSNRVDYIRVDILDNSTPPAVTVNNCQGNTMEIVFSPNSDPYDYYTLNFQDGPGNTIDVDNWSGNNNFTYTFTNSGTFRVRIIGHFNNGNSSGCVTPSYLISAFETLPIPKINRLEIQDATSARLTYQPLSQNLTYELLVDQGNGLQVIDQIDPNSNQDEFIFQDPNINLLTESAAFQLRVTDNCGSASQDSQIAYSVASTLTNELVTNTYSFDIDWTTFTDNFNELELFRGADLIQTLDQAQGITNIPFNNCNELGVLRLQRVDNGIISIGPPMVPFENTTITLPPTPFPNATVQGALVRIELPPTNFTLGEYIIYRKDISEQYSEIERSTSSTISDTTIPAGTGEVCYQIGYTDECGNVSELSQEICLVLSTSLGVPNAFSPDGDGINDEFKILDGIYNNFTLTVYNRWGIIMFRTSDPSQGWDGNFEDQPAKAGTYLFKITFENADNLPITSTGSFILIR